MLRSVGNGLLGTNRIQHHPGNQRDVSEGEDVARRRATRRSGYRGQGTFHRHGERVEVGPPENRHHKEGAGKRECRLDITFAARGGESDCDDGFPEGDDHEQRVALREVGRLDPEITTPGEERCADLNRHAISPHNQAVLALDEASDQDSENADECRDGIPIAVGPLVPWCADGEHGEPEEEHGRVPGGKPHTALSESIGDGESHEQHCCHGGQQGELHHRGLVPEGVQDPCVLRPRPPDEEQDEQPTDQALEGWVAGE
ncbi:MAG: hypothetical protein WBO84_02885 [Acidimicrobiia bacterium]